eukprot:10431222-Prorocentrum_lima.AAC.1
MNRLTADLVLVLSLGPGGVGHKGMSPNNLIEVGGLFVGSNSTKGCRVTEGHQGRVHCRMQASQ